MLDKTVIAIGVLLLIICLYRFARNTLKFSIKTIVTVLMSALLLTTLYIFGKQLNIENDIGLAIIKDDLTSVILIFIIIITIITATVHFYKNHNISDKLIDTKVVNKYFSKFWMIALTIFIFNIPYLILLNPACMTSDSFNMVSQGLGIYHISSGHPVFFTLIVSIFTNISQLLELDVFYGIFAFSIVQTAVMSALFAYVVQSAYKLKVNLLAVTAMLLFYCMFPVYGILNVTLWKGVMFGGFIAVFTVMLYKAKIDSDYLNNKRNLISLSVVILLIMLLRTNGILVIVTSMPFVYIILRKLNKSWIKLSLAFFIPIIIYVLFITVGFNLMNIQSFRSTEAFSVPYQHMSRLLDTEDITLDDEDMEFLEKVFKDIDHTYNPRISNKSRTEAADIDYFDNNRSEFLINWFTLVKKYPKELIKSWLNNNFGYWYPGANYWVINPEVTYRDYYAIDVQRLWLPDVGNEKIHKLEDTETFKFFTNIGKGYWTLFILYMAARICKRKDSYILFVPSLALFIGVMMGTPVYCEYRYVYGLFTSLPFIMAVLMFSKEKRKDNTINKAKS